MTFELFDRAMRRRVVARLRLEQDLRRALEEQQFVLHYQPLVSLRERRIVGVRGAGALAAPGARDGLAGGVHPGRRGHRA